MLSLFSLCYHYFLYVITIFSMLSLFYSSPPYSYTTSQRWKTMGYEEAFLRFLESIVDDMERKIKRQHERLEHDERYMKAVSLI